MKYQLSIILQYRSNINEVGLALLIRILIDCKKTKNQTLTKLNGTFRFNWIINKEKLKILNVGHGNA